MKKIYELVFVMLSVLSFTGYISAEPSFIFKTDFATGHVEYAAFENLNGDENPAIGSANTSSSTTVKLQQPPPNQLRITDLWNATLTYSGEETISVTLFCTLEKTGSGLIAEGSTDSISLSQGMKTITYDDVKSGNANTIFDRWGNLKTVSGDYIISIQIFNASGVAIGSDSISHRVDIPPFDVLEVALNKTTFSDSTFYQLLITNNYTGDLTDNKPKSFRITVDSDSILSISGGVSVGWERTPSKFPPGSGGVIWVNTSGEVPIGITDLGNIYFGNLESEPIDLTYEWRNNNDDIIYSKTIVVGNTDACVTWDLLTTDLVTSTVGNINGQSGSIGVGPAPAMSVFDYNNGQRLWEGNTGWIAGSLEVSRYVEFNTSPVSGNNLNVTNVSFNYGDNQIATNFFILNSQVFYSIDNWATSAPLSQTALVYLNTSMSTFTAANLNITVTSGQTFSLRIYPYTVKNGNAMTPTFAVHNHVKICGVTTPKVVTDGTICGTKFNDLNGNGLMDANEPGLPDWTINLGGTEDHTVFTDREGRFCFYGLSAGEYKISEEMSTGWIQTAPSSGDYVVMLAAGQNLTDINFGNRRRIHLKSPFDGASIKEGTVLVFSWEPLDLTPSSYKIKIVEIIGDQSPEQAFKTNKPHFEKDSIEAGTFQYPSTGPRFKANEKYAWQISPSLIDQPGTQSEVWIFTYGSTVNPDVTSPTLEVTNPVAPVKTVFTVGLKFSEPVTGVLAGITVENGDFEIESLIGGKEYILTVSAKEQTLVTIVLSDAIKNMSANANKFAGQTLTYTTGDFTKPQMVTWSPTDDETIADNHPTFRMTFNENVVLGAGGNLVIFKVETVTPVMTIPLTAAMISGKEVTVSYVYSATKGDLDINARYYVLVDGKALNDNAGNAFDGVIDVAAWTFKTGANVATSLDQNIIPSRFKIYPNPFGRYVIVDNASELSKVVISNIAGQVEKEVANPIDRIQLNELSNGVYFISLYSKENVIVRTVKIVKN